jgi:hypothetical protein
VVLSEFERERFDFESSRDAEGVRVMPGFEFDPFALIGGKVFVGYRSFDTSDPLLPNYSRGGRRRRGKLPRQIDPLRPSRAA